ncbi:unnamed protein product [Sphagnum compactum]
MRHGKEFFIGDSVVIEPNAPYEGHMWTWKAKITQFFIHESYGDKRVFSKASTTIRQHQHHHLLWLSNTTILAWLFYNHIHKKWPGNDVKPAYLLMHKFIPMPLVAQNNGILLAYELEDVSPRDHFFQLRMPGHCPPYPEVGDVVIVRNSSDRSFSMAVVKSVSTSTFTIDSQVEEESKRKAIVVGSFMQQDYFVGMVCLGMLEVNGWVRGTFKMYKASGITNMRSWHSIERILDDAQVTHHHNGEPTEWIWQDIRNVHELEQLVLEADFGPEINCGQFVECQYSSWFMADLLVQCPKQVNLVLRCTAGFII